MTAAAALAQAVERAPLAASSLLARVVEHYHRTFCGRKDAQEYLAKRGLTDPDLLKVFKVGYADGSLLKAVPKEGEVREQLLSLGIVTQERRELMGGCIVVPIPDPLSGEWTTLYGRGVRTPVASRWELERPRPRRLPVESGSVSGRIGWPAGECGLGDTVGDRQGGRTKTR